MAKMGMYGGSKRYSAESYARSCRTPARVAKARGVKRARQPAEPEAAPQGGLTYRLVGGRLVKVPKEGKS